ncbi:hypothetical protein [Scleromatobacter humisilvae]|uniref:Uncharacterized protein n=1 Tax=Scleromatobacter humisilvae TaxID=2897159 RepID=A0A9X2C2W3_9BURK|nr:hypothetical protein [Scleromatobacter humisilvae]MCK9687274.1 hypothetical protein [Scleromatobacter humisilvae]
MEQVIPEISEAQRHAIETFIAARRALSDREPRPAWFGLWKDTVSPSTFVDGSIPGDYACPPADTLRAVLPFFDSSSPLVRPARSARIPVKSVVGSSWRWHEGSLPYGARDSVESAIAYFTDDACAEGSSKSAHACLVNPLGIFYINGEGKNRVAFLARNGVEMMPCALTERTYPSASRLSLVAVREGILASWVCVLDSALAVSVPYPEFTLPILEAYGVRRVEWCKDWPMQATVMNSFRLQRGETDVMRNGTANPLSFAHLKAREADARNTASTVRLPLYSHRLLDQHPNYVRKVLAVFASLLVVCLVFKASEALLGLGGLLGAMAILAIPIGVRTAEVPDAEVSLRAADTCASVELGLEAFREDSA